MHLSPNVVETAQKCNDRRNQQKRRLSFNRRRENNRVSRWRVKRARLSNNAYVVCVLFRPADLSQAVSARKSIGAPHGVRERRGKKNCTFGGMTPADGRLAARVTIARAISRRNCTIIIRARPWIIKRTVALTMHIRSPRIALVHTAYYMRFREAANLSIRTSGRVTRVWIFVSAILCREGEKSKKLFNAAQRNCKRERDIYIYIYTKNYVKFTVSLIASFINNTTYTRYI